MFRFFPMSTERAFGLLLFSGVIVMTASKRTGIFSRLNWIKNIISDKDRDGPRGDFIVQSRDKSRKWKDFYSVTADDEAGMQCELEVKNETDEVLLLCWITPTGKLCNFTAIHDGSIRDKSVSNCHVELAGVHHAFVCIRRSKRSPKVLSDVTDEDFVFLYRPALADYRHKITLSKPRKDTFKAHIRCRAMKDKDEGVYDTSDKIYNPEKVCGFTCFLEPGVLEQTPGLLDALTIDLEMLRCLLPPKALMQLQISTPLWINIDIKYGPIGSPVDNSMCFHPTDGQKWLCSMGMRPDKAGGVEMYCAKNYLDYRGHWGVGGVLLHEYCHAYHFKHCKDGFNNEQIKEAYETAMEKKLYDCVPVHGPQGANGGSKAYACYNCMEFFAELSVAFHWQKDSHVDGVPHTCAIEYNKWFPHNFGQLKYHDLDTCKILADAWGVDLMKIPNAPGPMFSSSRPIPSLPSAMNVASSFRSPSKLE